MYITINQNNENGRYFLFSNFHSEKRKEKNFIINVDLKLKFQKGEIIRNMDGNNELFVVEGCGQIFHNQDYNCECQYIYLKHTSIAEIEETKEKQEKKQLAKLRKEKKANEVQARIEEIQAKEWSTVSHEEKQELYTLLKKHKKRA